MALVAIKYLYKEKEVKFIASLFDLSTNKRSQRKTYSKVGFSKRINEDAMVKVALEYLKDIGHDVNQLRKANYSMVGNSYDLITFEEQ
jgi:hypothetical protein